MRLLPLTLLSLALFSTPLMAQRARRGCEKTPVDSSVAGAPLYRACHVDRAARPVGSQPRPDWSPTASETRGVACFEAEFEFVVSPLGVPEVETVQLKRANNSRHAAAVQAVISQLRYRPAFLNDQPVRQVVEFKHTIEVRTVVTAVTGGSPGGAQSIGGNGVQPMRNARC